MMAIQQYGCGLASGDQRRYAGRPVSWSICRTGAWCKYTGWDTECLGLFGSVGYFGTSDGKVMQMEAGGSDDGAAYTAAYIGSFDHLGAPAALKTVHAARTVLNAASETYARTSVSTDYAVVLPSPPNSIADYNSDEWDAGLWDQSTWDAGVTLLPKTKWESIGRTGFSIAPQVADHVRSDPNTSHQSCDTGHRLRDRWGDGLKRYRFRRVNGVSYHEQLLPLYRAHYREMQTRLRADGIPIGDFKPRIDVYFPAMEAGHLLTFIVECDDEIVGYSNIWLTHDMHNGEFIAQEDTIFIAKKHRNGVGKRLVKHILADLQSRGVRRVTISPVTDLRVAKIWKRMGFRPTAELLTYTFKENADVCAQTSGTA